MNGYSKRLEIFKEFTEGLATLSKCKEKQVAAIIVDKGLNQVYSIGVNGGPKGLADCMCVLDGKYGCIHAEINALIKCNSDDKDKVMIATLSPCKQCAAAIINAPGSFSSVYFIEQWKDPSGLNMLEAAGIRTARI